MGKGSGEPGDGDTEAMELMASLWVRNQARVAGFIAAAVGDFHAVEDILQDVAVDVAKKFHTFDRERPFSPWLLGIAKNCIAGYYRRTGASKLVYHDDFLDRITEAVLRAEAVEVDERLEALQHCIEGLEGEARAVIEKRYQQAIPVNEIAIQLQTSATAISVRLHRIRKALANCVERRVAALGHRNASS